MPRDLSRNLNRKGYPEAEDERAVLESDDEVASKPDSRSESRGDARKAIGNNARDTDSAPHGDPFRNKIPPG